jgi:hypothetical protein
MTCQSTDLELLSRFQVELHSKVSPRVTVNQTVHLGIIRADKNETNLNIQEHISIARKTLYSLIPVGLNCKNGLNPLTMLAGVHINYV